MAPVSPVLGFPDWLKFCDVQQGPYNPNGFLIDEFDAQKADAASI